MNDTGGRNDASKGDQYKLRKVLLKEKRGDKFSMKKRILLILFIVAFSLLDIAGCSQVKTEKQAVYQTISTETAKKRMDSEQGIVLLDVRTIAENKEKRIPESVLIPIDEIKKQAKEKLKDKNTAVFVYCRSGNRSAIASQELANMGYTNVFDLGGINNWPYETESDKQ